MRLLLHGPVASVVLANAYSFWSTLYTETMAASGRLGQALVMRQSTVAFESIYFHFVLAQFALGIWCIISVVPVSGSHCSALLGVAEEYVKMKFSGDAFFSCAQHLA